MKDRTLDVVFSRFGWKKFTLTLRQKPRVVLRSQCRITRQSEPVIRRLRETYLGFCLRVFVTEFHPNLEKTTSSVLSAILINLCVKCLYRVKLCNLSLSELKIQLGAKKQD